MATTPNPQNPRGYGDVRQNDVSMPNAVNAIKNAISRDVQLVSEAIGTVESGAGATVTSVSVPANRSEWTDSGLTLSGEDAVVLYVDPTDGISHGAPPAPLYGAYHSGGAYLVWAIVTDGTTPTGDVGNQNDYRLSRTAYRRLGRLWLRIRDVGGSSDNQGAFDVELRHYADPGAALAPLSEIGALRDALAALTARVSVLESR